ncbi:gamma-glutamylcyclotransferase family protein [Pokkaliibacter sp. CJK22405]|uniref:gamma-glutamylcyclotransferase family protein n=1 Tax=Pokkaliibacter sp. CJK22405 TaxID=3384615 RepID=UPI0039853A09
MNDQSLNSASSTDHFWYFGYGSLVNDRTRPADTVAQAYELQGWRRRWSHRVFTAEGQGHTSLTVHADDSCSILGVLVQSPKVHLPALDEREVGYHRYGLACASAFLGADAFLYHSTPDYFLPADEAFPILQSYLDVVLSGYLLHYGEEAAIAFIQTTDGWDLPILNDRAAPVYPRAVALNEETLAHLDQLLAEYAGRA